MKTIGSLMHTGCPSFVRHTGFAEAVSPVFFVSPSKRAGSRLGVYMTFLRVTARATFMPFYD
ncbi:hypothetical protein PAECIP111802_04446 [Paenibacillus allorhizosphaerae]|uniref:Uncharacterized protein n=1 Tax=Paenibacillus allorhizosphaerae TaxID=2849866 RepID=A0ABM8VM19_9BACL|nr:hypothetical protein PAECIP111802_04446 [Paenibacillus allorhizosphaerae]